MLTRREFFRRCRDISVVLFGTHLFWDQIAEGFLKLSTADKPQVVFIQSQCCTGCSVSVTYGNESNFIDFITQIVRLQVHPNLSFSQGHDYMRTLEKIVDNENFYLVFEGSIPEKMKSACMFGDTTMYEYAKHVFEKAGAIIANGTCACYGGIPASNQNVTGAISVEKYLSKHNIKTPLIKTPGCPVQPDRLMGTVAYIVATGKLPPMKDGKPAKYYGDLIHNQCGRYQSFNQGKYLEDFDNDKHNCLLKVGCRGPVTYSDCSTRRWNGKASVCIESNAPCIGCIHPDFPFNSALYLEEKSFEDLPWSEMKKLLKS